MAGHPLDRVVWQALTTRHRHLAEGDDLARRYPAAVSPFGGTFDTTEASLRSLLALLPAGERVALFTTTEVTAPPGFIVVLRDSIDQMVRDAGEPPRASRTTATPLGSTDLPDMLALVEATRPGPFGPRTMEMGRYLGVRHEGRLVAMAGERMRLDGFTEVSAVCVDPAFRGRGLATNVVLAVTDAISGRGEVPFLHVFATNAPAISLYRKLGFVHRRRLRLVVLERSVG